MNLRFSPEDEAFRLEVRSWLQQQLAGEFKSVIGRGGPGDELAMFDERVEWERRLGTAGWSCLGWPKEYGGRNESLWRQVIFNEEYVRARAPGRLSHIGEGLLGPTIIALGTEAQKKRFLPPIVQAREFWAQGYSEPNAGSDLANVQTKAELQGDEWVITGQKIWTSGAHWADWAFVLCRTDSKAPKHKGISYLLVPMKQPGIEVRPILQMSGTSEFNEVFFDGARTAKENVVGEVNGGWKVAMATLSFERGASTLAQQLNFSNELDEIIQVAKANGRAEDPSIRQRLAQASLELKIMRLNALRMLSSSEGTTLNRVGLISKLYWASWHRDLGKLAMDVLGPVGGVEVPALRRLQQLFLFSRSDTIYAGSNEIQKNIIAERGLGLPPEPRFDKPTGAA
jgi:alkylation response protein AidB-like acyl-CoA dehydrogenase